MRFFLVIAFLMSWLLGGCATKPVALPSNWVSKCGPVPKSGADHCFYRVGDSPTRTLWYFPGLLESAEVLTSSYFDESGFRSLIESLAPIDVVVIGYGNGYYIRPPGTAGSPQLKEVTDIVMPFIEDTYKPAKPYLGLAISEGGANLLTLSMLKPTLFDRVVIEHPVVLQESVNPFNLFQICKACALIEANFTPQEWKIANPFYLMRTAKAISRGLMVACQADGFGLYPGAKDLGNLAKLMGLPLTFQDDISGCGHIGWQNGPILEYFK